MSDEPNRVDTWQTKLASGELCGRVQKSFGAWHTMIPYLPAKKQVLLQGLDHWSYQTGVRRAQTSLALVEKVFSFPAANGSGIWQVSYPSSKVTHLDIDLDPEKWFCFHSIGKDIFQASISTLSFRLLKIKGSEQYTVIEKAPLRRNLKDLDSSFCIMAEKFFFISGGLDRQGQGMLDEVVRYDIVRDIWEDMPSMNVARVTHDSCTHGTAVYVLCGFGQNGLLNSVERLETLDLQARWQIIQMPPTSLLTPTVWPVATSLNENEILIMGGVTSGDNLLADVLSFDTRDQTVRQIVKAAPFGFYGGYVSYNVSPGVVLALVFPNDNTDNLIEFRNDSIKVLK